MLDCLSSESLPKTFFLFKLREIRKNTEILKYWSICNEPCAILLYYSSSCVGFLAISDLNDILPQIFSEFQPDGKIDLRFFFLFAISFMKMLTQMIYDQY